MELLNGMLSSVTKIANIETRSISAENFTGEKGKGGMATEGTGTDAARDLGQGWKVSPSVVVKAGETFTLADYRGQGMIKHIWITDSAPRPRTLILRAYWDNSEKPSIEAPLGDFFACADFREYRQLTSLPVCVNPKRAFNCYWEMPFYKNFKFTIENISAEDIVVYYQIDFALMELPENSGYFHAQFRRVNPLPYKDVYTILDNVKGHGQYVGTYLFWGVNNNGWWGEGEIKFYLDGDKEFPTVCGTGTEDYFCGSWNFDIGGKYAEFCTPYAGLAKVGETDGLYKANQRFSMYRWHLPDPVYFKEDIKVTIQALGWRSGKRYLPLQDDISSVAFWYQDTICDSFPQLPDADYLEII
ncbi:MAG: DUF2961 domain-containing protein [Clostridia bacterium]|nr:DUF2961 domain-containing protein [Clostridia bacterium]